MCMIISACMCVRVCLCLSVFVKPSTSWMNMSRPTRNTRRINDNQVKKFFTVITNYYAIRGYREE